MSGIKITIVLPGPGVTPIGGVKVAYEYANHLSRRGHHLTIVHSASGHLNPPIWKKPLYGAVYAFRKITNSYTPEKWFRLDPSVRVLWAPSLDQRFVPDSDVVIATSWHTAEWVAKYPPSKGRRFYLIQHLETWCGPEERVYATWKLPLTKIVIAKWLEQIATDMGEQSVYIPNGLDFQRFSLVTPPGERNPHNVMMLYHDLNWKGSRDGLEALSSVRDRVPDLTATLFGVPRPPADLPAWVQYHRRPQQDVLRRLYNEAAVFVAPSWAEGWPLPPAEAMMSGAALAATDIGGHREYAIHEKTALLSPIKNPKRLADHISRLVQEDSFRLQLATQGHEFMQQFTWMRATDSLERTVVNAD